MDVRLWRIQWAGRIIGGMLVELVVCIGTVDRNRAFRRMSVEVCDRTLRMLSAPREGRGGLLLDCCWDRQTQWFWNALGGGGSHGPGWTLLVAGWPRASTLIERWAMNMSSGARLRATLVTRVSCLAEGSSGVHDRCSARVPLGPPP